METLYCTTESRGYHTQDIYNFPEADELCLNYITLCCKGGGHLEGGASFWIGTRKRFLVRVVFHMALGDVISTGGSVMCMVPIEGEGLLRKLGYGKGDYVVEGHEERET